MRIPTTSNRKLFLKHHNYFLMGCESSSDVVPMNPLQPEHGQQQPYTNKPVANFSLTNEELGQANSLFAERKYAEAAEIYRIYLEDHGNEEPTQIDGLGNLLPSLGYYEWHVEKHYREEIINGKYIGTVYDALSLCYQALKGDEDAVEKGIKWYSSMVDDYPENFAFALGLAHILCNKGVFEEAMQYYERVSEMKPDWVKPLECIAFIYEYKRVLKAKSQQMAHKILEIEPKNLIALFVMARNQKSPDEKIQKLKEINELHPYYGRAFNERGIVNGGAKNLYEQAIIWYTKATQVCPLYSSCYSNIGVNLELLKRHKEAMDWYFKAIEKDKEYKAPLANLIDIFKELKYDDAMIHAEMKRYNVAEDYFYYYLGLAHYDKKNYDDSIKFYTKANELAVQLKKHLYKIDNSMGITYDDMRKNDLAIKYYQKAIKSNPKYHSAYYNAAIVYKREGKLQQAKKWYKNAIEVNPRYSYACNNLANIYKNQKNYDEAIKYYKKGIQHLSTYTLALANMGVCMLKIGNFREAFNSMERAKECLPTDNNNLSRGNKDFLKTTLKQFDQQGEIWRSNGCITQEQRAKLKNLINSFESNFSKLYADSGKEPVSVEKVLKKQFLQIVRLVQKDQFELTSIDEIYDLIKQLFEDNEEYFHILPQLFMQYFYKNVLIKKRPVLEVENELMTITKRLSAKTSDSIPKQKDAQDKSNNKKMTFKLKHASPPVDKKVNLFKDAKYFESYEELYSEIIFVNGKTQESYKDYKGLVDHVRILSHGELFGIGLKIPREERYQFKVILRIYEKMFKKELAGGRVDQIIQKIDESLQKKQKQTSKHIQIGDVVRDIMKTWTEQITSIVKERKKNKVETKCEVSDLLRAKIMFTSVDHLKKAIEGVDDMCKRKNYEIIEMDNRLAKKQTQDVVFKIQIKTAVCELQLAMKQDESQYHFTHSIYELERSPLGVIFGSYIFMSKGFEYPFLENCKDIVEQLKNSKQSKDMATCKAAQYIVQTLNGPTEALK